MAITDGTPFAEILREMLANDLDESLQWASRDFSHQSCYVKFM